MARSPVPDWVPDDLPRSPGVYQFENGSGTALYVGKSVDVRRRVRSYFYGGGPDDDRLAEMLRLSRRVRVHRTGSDLEAQLEEAERIVRHRPRFNRALKNRARGWYIEIDRGAPFPRLRVTRSTRKSRARYFGPFRGRAFPEETVELVRKVFRLRVCKGKLSPDASDSPCLQHGIGLCTAPCAKKVGLDAYREQVRRAVRCLERAEEAARYRADLVAERDRRSEARAFEEALDLQRRIEWLDQLEARRYGLDQPWLDRSRLIVLPHAREGRGVLVPVARGRVLARHEVRWGEGAWQGTVRDACYAVRVAELRAGSVFPPEELAPALIVARWIHESDDEGLVLDLEELDEAGAVARLEREAA